MELEFKRDFEAARESWLSFWRGENRRPLIRCVPPKPGVEPVPYPHPYACAFGDVDALVEDALAWAASHEFLADAIPSYQVTFAPDHLAILMGADMQHSTDSGNTNWVEPNITDWASAEIRFRPDGYWWERTAHCIERFRARCDGRLIVYGTHLQGGLDCLAALRGVAELLIDMAERPSEVTAALAAVDRAVDDARTALAEALDVPTYGSMNRFGMYSDRAIDVPQCDVSCMISDEMFAEFEMPSLTHEVEGLSASTYHLDGPDALRHLDAVCSVEKLDMIQWQPGAGNYEKDWSDVYARTDALGKGQILFSFGGFVGEGIKRAWQTFRSRKLYFTLGENAAEGLDRFLEELEGFDKETAGRSQGG